jgi:hypothetical protein
MKQSPNRHNSQDPGSLGNVDDMEIKSTKRPDWVARRIFKSQEITQDFTTEEPMLFEDQFLTMHNNQYKKHKKKL